MEERRPILIGEEGALRKEAEANFDSVGADELPSVGVREGEAADDSADLPADVPLFDLAGGRAPVPVMRVAIVALLLPCDYVIPAAGNAGLCADVIRVSQRVIIASPADTVLVFIENEPLLCFAGKASVAFDGDLMQTSTALHLPALAPFEKHPFRDVTLQALPFVIALDAAGLK